MSRALVRLDRIAEAIYVLEDVRPVFEQRGLLLDVAALDLAVAEALEHAGLALDTRLEAQAADEIFTYLNRIEGTSQARFVDGIASLATSHDTSVVLRPEITERLHDFPHDRQEAALVRLLLLLRAPERQVTELGHRVSALSHASAATTGDPFMSALAELATAYTAPEGRSGQRHVDEARRLIELHDLHGLDVARAVVAARVLHRADDEQGAAAEITMTLTAPVASAHVCTNTAASAAGDAVPEPRGSRRHGCCDGDLGSHRGGRLDDGRRPARPCSAPARPVHCCSECCSRRRWDRVGRPRRRARDRGRRAHRCAARLAR